MSKSDAHYEELRRYSAFQSVNKPAWHGEKDIHGYDTETADGEVFLLTRCFDGKKPEYIDANGGFLSADSIWSALTHRKARQSVNVWYNLDFDAEVMLSKLLSDEEMAMLEATRTVKCDHGRITFIPGKFLKLTSNGHVVWHYDVSQFFFAPLESAADDWLERSKADENIDVTAFGSDGDMVNNYILENWFEIRKYGMIDAELTRDLWGEAVRLGEKLNIPMGSPISTGYLAEQYLRAHMGQKVGHGRAKIQRMAWDAFSGGRFESFKRGHVGEVVGADINSAYPTMIEKLPDPETVYWAYQPNIRAIRDCHWGFVRAEVTTSDVQIQPFGTKNHGEADGHPEGTLYFPRLEGETVTVLADTFTFALENRMIESFEIKDAVAGFEVSNTRYPWRDGLDIGGIYETRKNYEKESRDGPTNPKMGHLLKIILNSMFGKTCQTTAKRRPVGSWADLEENEKFVSTLALPKRFKRAFDIGIAERLEVGNWWNPFTAAYITGLTRLELHRRAIEYDLVDDTVMFATDCVMFDAEAYRESSFESDLVRPGLGWWDYDYKGDAFVIGSGVYEVDKGSEVKTATRGFREAQLEYGLRNEAQKAGDTDIQIESTRPKTMGEAVWLDNGEITDIGKFTDFERSLRADMDSKRDWSKSSPTFDDLLLGPESSRPLEKSG